MPSSESPQRLLWRQTAIYSILTGALIVIAAVAIGQWTGALKPMINKDFKYPPSDPVKTDPVPCPAGQSPAYPEPNAVPVKVLNGTGQQGLALETATAMAARGFVSPESDNGTPYDGVAKLVAGVNGVNNAYSVLRFFPEGAVITMDLREDTSVDVILGTRFKALRTEEERDADSSVNIVPIESCQDPASIIAELTATNPPA
ncbi:MAG: LytR C-terminal domain-containing protein [Bifidobacteriaceae bacterium]|jgi:hypothetical protein|nr:LytR C-terminal domain-containing protein [Bifidobacteriaceae bacterium]